MELKSQYDFRALRKAQSEVTKKYNRAAKAIEKLELGEDINKQFEAILIAGYDADLKKAADGASFMREELKPAESFV